MALLSISIFAATSPIELSEKYVELFFSKQFEQAYDILSFQVKLLFGTKDNKALISVVCLQDKL
ncbi:hypothetical protein [Kosmotoga pacifica]|uniref:hypothetical protein n=1 Tax=Kosmotoga pacifica TaxID=1330330 RepID=UPI000A6AD3FB|nr:hypothetical protein [Kosmotoga pacifica]